MIFERGISYENKKKIFYNSSYFNNNCWIGISICIAYFLHQKYAAEDTEDSLNTQSDGENADSKESAVQIEIRLSSDSGKESAVICGLNEQMKKYGTIQRDLMIERN